MSCPYMHGDASVSCNADFCKHLQLADCQLCPEDNGLVRDGPVVDLSPGGWRKASISTTLISWAGAGRCSTLQKRPRKTRNIGDVATLVPM